jgi:integrase
MAVNSEPFHARQGATLYDVQYYLCHSTPTMTMIYAHVSDKRDEKIAAFLE